MAFTWLIIGIVVIVLFVAAFKSQDLMFIFVLIKKYGFLFIIVGLVLFFIFSFYNIYNLYSLDLTSFNGFKYAGKVYFKWFLSLFDNIGRITGYAVNQDWMFNNSTNITK